ncbi:TGF-beta receptor type-2-like isoform X2 [Acanthaster planci]|nr:TGF-beta receptor type-2-like isoform X2 [Acanthaster planci]
MDRLVCRSRCDEKVACQSSNSYCLIATYTAGSDVQEFASVTCFENQPLSESDVTPHYCGAPDTDYSTDDSYWFIYTCTCTHDYCNDAIYLPGAEVPKPTPHPPTTEQGTPSKEGPNPVTTPKDDNVSNDEDSDGGMKTLTIVLASSLPVVIVAVLGVSGFYIYRYCQKLKQDRKPHPPTSNTESTSLDLTTEDSDVKVIGQDTPPESPVHLRGNYLPISLSTVIGRGRFGAVWKADLKEGDGPADETVVAVKIFHEIDSASWSVEKEMFTDETVMLKHDNVVEFIAAEVRQGSYDSQRQFWLVTRYYSKGSLYQYLKHHTVGWQELCRLAGTTARGVAHLHAEVYGPHGLHKVPVAHRDLKSSNVLVKDDGTCAIADFGLSIQLDPTLSIDQLANSGQAGTPRYMAPEALESKVNLHDIESFKQMDVYSLSLIVWEIAKRCHIGDVVSAAPEHQLPFFDSVAGRANIEDMKTVVALQRERPTIPPSWSENTGMQLVSATMEDCWDSDPEARLTAHCVEARFTEIITWTEGEQNPGHNDINTITVV